MNLFVKTEGYDEMCPVKWFEATCFPETDVQSMSEYNDCSIHVVAIAWSGNSIDDIIDEIID